MRRKIIQMVKNSEPNIKYTILSGKIEMDDFNPNKPNRNRINNQAEAQTLELKLLRKKAQEQKIRSYTIEDLKRMRLISNTDNKPSPTLTDEKWQKEFQIRKMFITPYPKNIKRMSGRYYKEIGKWNSETQGKYDGCTNWQSYCAYINDVLSNIQSGQVDYCYFIYQIMDLVKFHYQTLKTKYCDGYWEVWLAK